MQNMFIIKTKDQYRFRDACEKKIHVSHPTQSTVQPRTC